jgi:uncharacterized protein (TIGR03437 family)
LCRAQGYTITTVAGNGSQTYSGDGGQAASAGLYKPFNVALDAAGNIFIADTYDCLIRKVSPAGIITTVAGTPGIDGYSGDGGPAGSALLSLPGGVAVDAAGNVYIADSGNARIRKVSPAGIITTIAGGGNSTSDGVPATQAELGYPLDIVLDAAGNLYFPDSDNRIRKVSASGTITTVAGTLANVGSYSGDGGPATNAGLSSPSGLALDAAGNIYIADTDNFAIRKVSNGIITTVAGKQLLPGFGEGGYSGDGGPATSAELSAPSGVAVDAAGNLFIADTNNQRIREVLAANGTITTVAGNGTPNYSGDGGPATSAELYTPNGVTVSVLGGVYISDTGNGRVRLLTPQAGSQAPAVTLVQNAEGGSVTIAPNTWVSIKGSGLAPAGDMRIWQGSDFVNNQMPTQLDGVGVTMNGESAYVYYISPSQVNVLTPPDLASGPVQVKVTTGGATSATFTAQAQEYSLSFFIFGAGPYVVGTHLNSGDLGPASLYPGLTTPAAPGELVVLYANGFGPVSPAVRAGSETQSGSLPTLPLIDIGGIPASVQFAGLVSPGLYQFNVVVPTSAPNGDNALTAQFNGLTTQSGVLLTVQNSSSAVQVESLSLSAAQTTSGSSVQGTVFLSNPAGSAGVTVTLSSNSATASVPSSVTIPPGATSASFMISTGTVSSNQTATITATYNGRSAQAVVTVTQAAATPPIVNLNGTFNYFPVGYPSIQIVLMVTLNPDKATYTATLGSEAIDFLNGVASNQNQTLTFSTLENGSGSFSFLGGPELSVSSASLTFTLTPTLVVPGEVETGTLTGTLSVTGTATGGGTSVTASGPIAGTYTATLPAQ